MSWRPIDKDKYDSVSSNDFDKTQHKVAMEKNRENCNLVLKDETITIPKKNAENITKFHKCNQCNYTSSRKDNFRNHMKTHSGEKSNRCNQCDYACSDPSSLRTHKYTVEKSQINATNVTSILFGHTI